LEYLKALLSPQVTIAGVIIFFLLKFKASVEAALARLSSFKGPAGVEATFDAQRQIVDDRQKIVETKQAVEAAQTTGQTDQSFLRETQDLLKKIAEWWVFEKIYRTIFKSQINLLRHLRSLPERRATWIELFTFYQQGLLSQGFTATTYPYENYMNFLAINGLITWQTVPGTNQTVVSLTEIGDKFLQYLTDSNYNIQERPY
jgi:hypothetical protein